MDVNTIIRLFLLLVFCVITSVIDIKTKIIPNKLIIIMLISWVIIMLPMFIIDPMSAISLIRDGVLGAALGGGMFLLVYLISKKGLGGGDVKFMAVSGLYLGFYLVVPAIFYSSILAALFALILIVKKKITRKDTLPLAPFICIGTFFTVLLHNIT